MNNAISRSQLFFLIIQTQIGIGLLSLPSKIHSTAKGDAWISVLLAGIIIQLLLLVYWQLLKKFPNYALNEITTQLLGLYIGKAINFMYYIFFVLIAAYASTLYIQLIHVWMLSITPGWILLLLVIGTSVYLAQENLRVIARFYVIISILFGLLIFISFLNFANELHFTNMLPIGQSGFNQILQGSNKTFFSMLGFEITLFIFTKVQNTPKGLLSVISLANCFVTLFYTYFIIICLISLSPEVLDQVNEPVLYILKSLSYKLFDRMDLIFITIWIIPMTTTIVSYLALAGKSLTTQKTSYQRMVRFSGGIIYMTSLYLFSLENVDFFGKWLEYGYLIMITAVPVFLWLMSFRLKNNVKVG